MNTKKLDNYLPMLSTTFVGGVRTRLVDLMSL